MTDKQVRAQWRRYGRSVKLKEWRRYVYSRYTTTYLLLKKDHPNLTEREFYTIWKHSIEPHLD